MITKFNYAADQAPTLNLQVPPDPRYARTVRDALTGFAHLHGVAPDDLDALMFAVGEALANAIEHAKGHGDIEIECRVDDREIIATVIDGGRGISSTKVPQGLAPLPEALHERGRGIPIMQRCTDLFSIESLPGRGTAITLGLNRRTATT